ncbi:MAG: indole-3-glycerol phosphate synthase TrpC [Candidatus Korobacteraceae bacterium]
MSTVTSFLASISEAKRAEMAVVSAAERAAVRQAGLRRRAALRPHVFRQALSNPAQVNIIAEVKRSSPTAGAIRPGADPVATASVYAANGAAAISVLTEPKYFSGSLDDLRAVCARLSPAPADANAASSLGPGCPVLRKDFIVDSHQIYEAAAAGAEAVLLIVASLAPSELVALRTLAEDELGLDALVEVHAEPEMRIAIECGAAIIGVNNRNLATLEVSLDTSRALARYVQPGRLLVSESGLRTPAHVRELRALGYGSFLIGETLMRSDDPAGELTRFITEAGRG